VERNTSSEQGKVERNTSSEQGKVERNSDGDGSSEGGGGRAEGELLVPAELKEIDTTRMAKCN
jgi:hypothetical protein